MKRILPLFALLPSVLLAAEVSTDSAARAAKAWVDRGYAMGELPAGRDVAGVRELEDAETGARLLLASFEGGGWVLLSADDLVDPVIAFSEEGDGFDVDDENPFWTLVRGDIAAREAAAGVVRGGDIRLVADHGNSVSFQRFQNLIQLLGLHLLLRQVVHDLLRSQDTLFPAVGIQIVQPAVLLVLRLFQR